MTPPQPEDARRRPQERLEALASLATALLPIDDPQGAAEQLVRHALPLVGAEGAAVGLLDAAGLRILAAHGIAPHRVPPAVPEHATDPVPRAAIAQGNQALATVQLHRDGRTVGLVALTFTGPREFDEEDRAALLAMASIGGQALHRAQMEIERASADSALRKSEARYRTLFESIDEGFCIVEIVVDDRGTAVDYRFLEVNPAFERQTGLQGALGRLATEAAPGLERFWYETYGRVGITGEPTRFVNHSAPLGRWFDVYAFRVDDPGLRRVAILFADITRRIEAETARDAQLASERQGREAAEAFAAVMSHELRTPVTSIYGTAMVLARNPGRADAAHLLADIADEANRLNRMVDDLMVLSRMERGVLDLAPEPVLLRPAVDEVVADVRRRYPSVSIVVEVDRGLPAVVADTTALRQALNNLLSNAAKFAGQDGPVTITAHEAADRVVVDVRDAGPGLGGDPEALFRLFYRAPHTSKLASGTGIGLYVTRQLLAAMGSDIEARERTPAGASFSFALTTVVDEEDAVAQAG